MYKTVYINLGREKCFKRHPLYLTNELYLPVMIICAVIGVIDISDTDMEFWSVLKVWS